MRVFEHHVTTAQLRDRCARYVPWWAQAQACAEWNFATMECHIWFSSESPPSRCVLQHERDHCRGYKGHVIALWPWCW